VKEDFRAQLESQIRCERMEHSFATSMIQHGAKGSWILRQQLAFHRAKDYIRRLREHRKLWESKP
jgi:site-specific recombinase XerD